MLKPLFLILVPLVALTHVPGPANAGGGGSNADLARAKEFYMGLRFDAVLGSLDKALKFENRYGDLVEIYELMGITYAALGQPKKARDAYAHLLMIDPEHKLPDYVAPRMGKPLEEARAESSKSGYLRATDSGPSSVYPGDPITVELRLENDPLGMVDRFRISYRIRGSSETRVTEVRAGPTARVALDLDLSKAAPKGALEYFCTLLDRNGGELGFVGSPDKPSTILWEPKPKPPQLLAAATPVATAPAPIIIQQTVESGPPFYKSWWFWTTVGVVAVGTTGIIIYRALPRDVPWSDHANQPGNALNH